MSTTDPPGTGRRTHARRWRLRPPAAACAIGVALAWGCAPAGETPAPAGGVLALGARALADGDYAAATAQLREVAARCESGDRGRRAVLLLASAALDPRNPDASAADGARLAVHFLRLPETAPEERRVAETFYLLARGYGAPAADTLAAPAGVVAGLAARFDSCGTGRTLEEGASVGRPPELPDSSYVARYRAERDRLAARVHALESELARIRALLQEGIVADSSGVRP